MELGFSRVRNGNYGGQGTSGSQEPGGATAAALGVCDSIQEIDDMEMPERLRRKFVAFSELRRWRANRYDWVVTATNGCFDILHSGHVRLLEEAASLGDTLIVGINSDRAVRLLKGETRPINNHMERATVLAALACVSAVTIFDSVVATPFLSDVRPDHWVKGGDYTLGTLDSTEREAVAGRGGRIHLVKVEHQISKTKILEKCGQE